MKGKMFAILLAMVLTAAFFISGCSDKPAESQGGTSEGEDVSNVKNPNSGVTDVVFWGWGNDASYQPYYNNFAADMPQYNLIHDVSYTVPFSDFVTAYLADQAPDIYISKAENRKQLLYTNMLRPMNEYYENDESFDINKLDKTVVDMGTGEDGQLYFWPDINGNALYYNKQHFATAGLSEAPKTWTELINYAKACTITDSMGTLTQLGFWDGRGLEQTFAGAMGVTWFDKSGQTLTINDEMTQRVFEFCDTLPDKVYGGRDKVPQGVSFGAELNNLSMEIQDINVRPFQLNNFAGQSWGMGYIPVADDYTGEQLTPVSSTFIYCLPYRSNNPQGGWDFLRWYYTNGLVVGEKVKYDLDPSRFVPYINTYEPTKEMVDNTFTKDLADENAKAMLTLRDEMVAGETFQLESAISNTAFSEVYNKYITEIALGNMTVKDALDAIQKDGQTAIDDWLAEQQSAE